ncbi:MAG: DUF4355 domain-containing protein [Solobacterium sp.]|jgi:hypothetical protein|nr:DUF4355 domain-containing protein [Solobacterium sp.]MCH4281522.1 DUF4355 domain-containing protein [Solobacterium sp.]
MAEFVKIETQEELDRIVNDRLKRERETNLKKYEGWMSPEDQKKTTSELQKKFDDLTASSAAEAKKYAKYDKDLADRDAKIKGYETGSVKTRIALKTGLPYEMAERLRGDTEEDIQKDADSMKAMMGTNRTAPLADTNDDASVKDSKKAAYLGMLHDIKGE